jgi:hypothetical protein
MFKFKITCDQATTICDKSQYGKASFFEILRLKIHFVRCKFCALYSKQNNRMSRILKTNTRKDAICSMTKEEKEAIRTAFEKKTSIN